MKIENEQHKAARNGMIFGVTMAVAVMLIAANNVNGAEPGEKKGRPLKVIILAGQSNMQEPAGWHTLAGLADSPETKPLYDKLVDENGKVRIHREVCIAIAENSKDENGNKISTLVPGGPVPRGFGGLVLGKDQGDHSFGPELGFAATMYETLHEPILIIKTAWGGKSLCSDFRPPTDVEWTPPEGHPDHPGSAVKRAIPTTFELPEDFQPPTEPRKNMQIFSGCSIGEMKGVYPIYVHDGYGEKGGLSSIPLQKGDLILGLNGIGLDEDPVRQWRDTWSNKVREGDWKLKITRWRPSAHSTSSGQAGSGQAPSTGSGQGELGKGKGTIETFEIDTALTLKDGRAGIPAFLAEKEEEKKKRLGGGEYYWKMLKCVQDVLKDPGKYHPAYDPKQGYELAGFVWLQGYNDLVASTVYPSGNKPRGYEQYSWLLAHFIRNVRKELKTPELPFIIGVFGQGGKVDKPVPFREAMAAPASYPEFKGNVVAVQTFEFWDARIPEIEGKLDRVMEYKGGDTNHPYAKLQAEIKAYKEKMEKSDVKGKAANQLKKQIQGGILEIVRTPEETAYLQNNRSNQGYHYYGSPKFFVRAGDAFAKALIDIRK